MFASWKSSLCALRFDATKKCYTRISFHDATNIREHFSLPSSTSRDEISVRIETSIVAFYEEKRKVFVEEKNGLRR